MRKQCIHYLKKKKKVYMCKINEEHKIYSCKYMSFSRRFSLTSGEIGGLLRSLSCTCLIDHLLVVLTSQGCNAYASSPLQQLLHNLWFLVWTEARRSK